MPLSVCHYCICTFFVAVVVSIRLMSFLVSPFLLSHVAVSRPCRMSEFNSDRAWMVEMMLAG